MAQAVVVQNTCSIVKGDWLTHECRVMITQAINVNPDWFDSSKLHVIVHHLKKANE